MKRILVTIGLLVIFAAYVGATWSWLGFQQLTVGATAVGFTKTIINASGNHAAATAGACRIRTAEVSYTIDGTTATGSIGSLAEIGDIIQLSGNDVLNNFLAIRTGATSAQMDCNFGAP